MRHRLEVVALALAVTACGSVDWVDFVQHEGVTYDRVDGEFDADAVHAALGDPIGEVTGSPSSDFVLFVPRPSDGHAPYLPVGTELRSIDGFSERFRIAAQTPDGPAVYQAQIGDEVETASDHYGDIDGRVIAVVLRSEVDGSELGELDADRVDPAVDAWLRSTYLGAPDGPQDGRRIFIDFELDVGPPVRTVVYIDTSTTHDGFEVSADFVELVLSED